MSDDLRDRIATIIAQHGELPEAIGEVCECGWHTWDTPHATHVADALVTELGLRREAKQLEDGEGGYSINYKTGERTSHSKPCTTVTRWVTEWSKE